MKKSWEKFQKWKRKRIARRADRDVVTWRRILRYSINLLSLMLVGVLVYSCYMTYQKYTNLRGLANMTAVKVNENDIEYQKLVDKIFIEGSISEQVTQIDIEELALLYEKTSKNEAINLINSRVNVLWEEYSKRLLLNSKIDKNEEITQEEIKEYTECYNKLNKSLVDIDSQQKDNATSFVEILSKKIQVYNDKITEIDNERKLLEMNTQAVKNLSDSSVELIDFVNKKYSDLEEWSNKNSITVSVNYKSTSEKSLDNIVFSQYPNVGEYNLISNKAILSVTIYSYQSPPSASTSTNSNTSSNATDTSASSNKSSTNKSSSSSTTSSTITNSVTEPSLNEEINDTVRNIFGN